MTQSRSASAALAVVVAMLAACASHEDPAALAAQQVEVNELLASNAAFAARDYKKAFDGYLPWAQKGDDFSEARIAYMYYTGLGVAKDEDQARQWYEKAVHNGDLAAATDLGYDYLAPDIGEPDYAQALKWFKYAADNGDLFADIDLSILYQHGLGVPKDTDRALHFLNEFVSRQKIKGDVTQYRFTKFANGDNIGGFMVALSRVVDQAAQHAGLARFMGRMTGLSFHYADGQANQVTVARSSGDPVADAAAAALLEKALLPPVLPSMSHQDTFTVYVAFDSAPR